MLQRNCIVDSVHKLEIMTHETQKEQQLVPIWLTWMVNPCIPYCNCPELLCVEMNHARYQPGLLCCCQLLRWNISPTVLWGQSQNKAERFHSFQKQSLHNEQNETERWARCKGSGLTADGFDMKSTKVSTSFILHFLPSVGDTLMEEHVKLVATAPSWFHFISIQFKSRGVFTFFVCTCKNNVEKKRWLFSWLQWLSRPDGISTWCIFQMKKAVVFEPACMCRTVSQRLLTSFDKVEVRSTSCWSQ